jgi:hypothetical protein
MCMAFAFERWDGSCLRTIFGDGEKHSLCIFKEELFKWSGPKKSPMNDNLRIPTFETLWQAP